jgi:hypothetical protein
VQRDFEPAPLHSSLFTLLGVEVGLGAYSESRATLPNRRSVDVVLGVPGIVDMCFAVVL